MSQDKSILNENCGFFNKISTPELAKISIYNILVIFIPGLIIGVIIASVFGPVGYNIWDNYISDLGSIRFTPAPFILDFIAMITAILSIPLFFYLKNLLLSKTIEKRTNSKGTIEILTKYLTHLGVLFFIIGAIGLFGIGLFSEDRTTELGLHSIFSIVVFGGIGFGGLFTGLLILFKDTIFPRILSPFMIFGTPGAGVIFLIHPSQVSLPFLEWMMLFSIVVWLIPILIITLNQIKKSEK